MKPSNINVKATQLVNKLIGEAGEKSSYIGKPIKVVFDPSGVNADISYNDSAIVPEGPVTLSGTIMDYGAGVEAGEIFVALDDQSYEQAMAMWPPGEYYEEDDSAPGMEKRLSITWEAVEDVPVDGWYVTTGQGAYGGDSALVTLPGIPDANANPSWVQSAEEVKSAIQKRDSTKDQAEG